MEYLMLIGNALLVALLSPLTLGIIRKTKAVLQNRAGASIFQPYRDLAKLFRKDEVISEDASWIFRAAPYIVFGSTLAIATAMPLLRTVSPAGDILVFVYLVALGAFFLALSGMDPGSGFGGFGASREMTISALTEGGLILSLAGLAFMSGATNLSLMPPALEGISGVGFAPLILLAASFGIALLAENARMPIDNPATHLELTMVHEAMILEYSGKRLALMEWAASNKLLIFILLFVNLFSPWDLAVWGILIGAALGCVAIGFIESSMSKLRIFRVPDLLFASFTLSAIAILIITI